MKLSEVIEQLKGSVKQWRLRVTDPLADKLISPHPGHVIVDLLVSLYYSPEFPRQFDQVISRLHREVREAVPKFPSMERPGDDWVLPVLEHLENFTNMLLKPQQPQSSDGEWSKPMSKAEIMGILRIDSYRKFKAFAREYGIRQVGGNRQLWQVRIDRMDSAARSKLS